jgi:hypothetical protein
MNMWCSGASVLMPLAIDIICSVMLQNARSLSEYDTMWCQ